MNVKNILFSDRRKTWDVINKFFKHEPIPLRLTEVMIPAII